MMTDNGHRTSTDAGAGKRSGQTGCLRCGTCCTKGGPALHLRDRPLVESGAILASRLYTLRKGEIARDPVRKGLITVGTDVIKVKGRPDAWTCVFFDGEKKRCRVYDDRPLECRAMECWDTREIERVCRSAHLTRKDLLREAAGLWDFIDAHEKRCGYDEVRRLAADPASGTGGPAAGVLLEMIRYDAAVRELAVEKGNVDPAHLEFLFGRPLARTIRGFGLRLETEGAGCRLVRESGAPGSGIEGGE
jgi:Fe-S-cluster containining protein